MLWPRSARTAESTELSALAGKFRRYVRSPSTRMAAFGGLLMYLSYAYAHGSWANPALIGVSVFVGVFLPSYAKLSNKAELWANNQFGFVTAGRLGRFLPQLAVQSCGVLADAVGRGFQPGGHRVGRRLAPARRSSPRLRRRARSTSAATCSRAALAMPIATCWSASSFNMVLAALGTAGVPGAREAFLVLGFGLGALFFGVGLLSDLRSVAGAQGRHRVVLRNLQSVPQHPSRDRAAAMDERQLDKIIIHPTLIPRLHADAFRKGEIRVGRLERRLPDLREDRQGRCQRRLLPDRQHLPAARDAQGADRAGARRGGTRQQGRGGVLSARPTTPAASRA